MPFRIAGLRWLALVLATATFAIHTSPSATAVERGSLLAAADSITSTHLQAHVDVLADDTFEGREAGSRGGRAAAGYLTDQFQRMGMAGAGEDGGYFQSFSGRYRNLLVRLEGRDPTRKHEVVVVGAHYDHVGYGSPTNSYGPTGYIHNGADDNASGTAALLEVMRAFSKLPAPPARSILFAFWDGEEKGLLGSKHWTANPTVPLQKVVVALNVDMVGRLQTSGLQVFGTRTSPGYRQLVSRQNAETSLPLDFRWEVEANSDHHSFFERNIPFLMLHTGLHDDYHRPSDDSHKLNAEGMQQISRLMFLVVHALADQPQPYPFRSASQRESDLDRRRLETPHPAAPPRLGISWQAETSDAGRLAITRVANNSPAQQAGLKVGDAISALDGRPISDGLQFQTQVLAAQKKVALTVASEGDAEPREVVVNLAGNAFRLGISWREDPAEPGSVIISRVVPGSVAHRGGLRLADRILEIDHRTFADGDELRSLAEKPSGPVAFLVERRGRLLELILETLDSELASAAAE
jgi:hypothetical protein